MNLIIKGLIDELASQVQSLSNDEKIEALNQIKMSMHSISPFKDEPVDCVIWVKSDSVTANDYNPNSVAPPEMKLLERSIEADGYTQPIVTWDQSDHREVVDGFHRSRIGKESKSIRKRVNGYLPVVTIRQDQEGRNDRMASTIRHNRARGKHKVESMSEIVVELKRRCWSDQKIANELGMDQDEVLRLMQISGLAEMFANQEFSEAWEIEWPDNESEDSE